MGFSVAIFACADAHKGRFPQGAGLSETGATDPHNETPYSGVSHGTSFFVWQDLRQARLLPDLSYRKTWWKLW